MLDLFRFLPTTSQLITGSRQPPFQKKRSVALAPEVLSYGLQGLMRGAVGVGEISTAAAALMGSGGRSAGYPSSSMSMIWPGTVASSLSLAMCRMP